MGLLGATGQSVERRAAGAEEHTSGGQREESQQFGRRRGKADSYAELRHNDTTHEMTLICLDMTCSGSMCTGWPEGGAKSKQRYGESSWCAACAKAQGLFCSGLMGKRCDDNTVRDPRAASTVLTWENVTQLWETAEAQGCV